MPQVMKWTTISIALMLALQITTYGKPAQQDFDKSRFYEAMALEKVEAIDEQLEKIAHAAITRKDAYEGALLMKKAGLVQGASRKLRLFKEGRIKLEKAISEDAGNPEWRFLRIMIQEHAPKIVKYNKDIEKDSQLIKSAYKNLPAVVQKAITDYSRQSKVLSAKDH